MKKKIALGLVLLITVVFIFSLNRFIVTEPSPSSLKMGGPCSFKKFRGKCTILTVEPDGGVRFKFTPTEPLDLRGTFLKNEEDVTNDIYTGTVRYLLESFNNKPTITQQDLNAHNVKKGAVFDCEIEIITDGTCSPINFNFFE